MSRPRKSNTTLRYIIFIIALLSLPFLLPKEKSRLPQLTEQALEIPKAERMAAKAAYFNELYKDPRTGKVPLWSALQKQVLLNNLQKTAQLRSSSDLNWLEAGPNNVGGRTRAIALDKRDSKVIITGGVRGGIWKSTDDGVNWKHIPGLIENESIMSVVQDPVELDHWYAVTGELVAAGANFFGGGIYRSIDNGESWELFQYELSQEEERFIQEYQRVSENNLGGHPNYRCGAPCDANPFIYSSKVAVSPSTQSVFVATNGYGIKRSVNSLESFQHSLPTPNILNIPEVTEGPITSDTSTTLLLAFEENLNNATNSPANPTFATNNSYTEGIHGFGAQIGLNDQFNYPKAGIIDGRQGSVAFWFKPNWDDFESEEHDMVLVGNFPYAIFIHHVGSIVEIIHTAGDLPGQPWAVAQGSTRNWKKGEWIHLAFTWGGKEIAYYENGKLIDQQRMDYTLPDNSGTNIQFGREFGNSMDGTIDELQISNRARTPEEILVTYLKGGTGPKIDTNPTQRPNWSDVDVDQEGQLLAYLSGNPANGAGIYFSKDDGVSWENLTPDDWDSSIGRGLVRFAPSNPEVAYVFFEQFSPSGNLESFYKIDLLQKSMEDRSGNLPKFIGFSNPDDNGLPLIINSWHMQLDVKPDDENFVVVGGVRLARSYDGFTTNTDDLLRHNINSNSHVDNHIVVFDPKSPDKAWLGNDGGIFKTENILRESTTPFANVNWIHKFKGYNVVTYYALGLPRDENDLRIIGGTQDRGTPVLDRSNTDDIQASIGDPFGGDGGFSFLGKNHAYVYAAVGQSYRLRYNADGLPSFDAGFLGLTGTLINRGHGFINPFVVDLEDESAMYYPIGNKMLRFTKLDEQADFSDLQADDWEEPDGLAAPEGSYISALELSGSPKDILYYAVQQFDELPHIYRLEDAENATMPTNKFPITGATPGSVIRSIGVNPNNADEIVAVISSSNVPKLFHSLDGGSTFTNVDGNLANTENLPGPNTNWITILPFEGKTYYVLATSTGVFATQILDGANTIWEQQAPEQIGFASAQMVKSRPSDGLIAVATYGRGIFIGSPNDLTTSTTSITESAPNFKIFPNPARTGTAQIQFELSNSQRVGFVVNDMTGKEVWRQTPETFGAGKNQMALPMPNLSAGIYVIRLETNDQVWTKKWVLNKN